MLYAKHIILYTLNWLTIPAEVLVTAPRCFLSSGDALTFALHHLVYSSRTCLEKKTNAKNMKSP